MRRRVYAPKNWRRLSGVPFCATMFVGIWLKCCRCYSGCIIYSVSQFNQQMRYEWIIYEGIEYTLQAALYAVIKIRPPFPPSLPNCERHNSNGPPLDWNS